MKSINRLKDKHILLDVLINYLQLKKEGNTKKKACNQNSTKNEQLLSFEYSFLFL